MRVLIIGQLPKEIGGNYTTGAANVVYELGKHNEGDVEYFTFGTNIKYSSAVAHSKYNHQYIGYKISPFRIILQYFLHPIDAVKSIYHYIMIDHQNPLRYAFYEYNIREAINNVCPDLIHVNSISNVSPVKFALGKKHIPILLTCHGIFYRGNSKDKKARDAYLGNIKLVDAFSGLTRESLDEYENILGIPRDRVTVIPNGVDCSRFYYSPEYRKKKRDEYGISDSCIVFITVASLHERKGQLEFIKLLELLNIEYQYWIIGKGPYETEIIKYVENHGMTDKVKLLGYQDSDQLYKFYSAADVYAHPSKKEGQALCELEAHATGLPTIVNKSIVGTIANPITINDYLVIDFSKLDVLQVERWLMINRERYSRANLDWKVIAQQYAKLYKQILNLDI